MGKGCKFFKCLIYTLYCGERGKTDIKGGDKKSLKLIHSRNIIKILIIDKTNEKLRQEVTKCDKEIDELKVKMQQMQK